MRSYRSSPRRLDSEQAEYRKEKIVVRPEESFFFSAENGRCPVAVCRLSNRGANRVAAFSQS